MHVCFQIGLSEEQHLTAVNFGILASLVTRLLVLLFSAALLERFWWVMIVFAAFLLYSGCKMLLYPGAYTSRTSTSSSSSNMVCYCE